MSKGTLIPQSKHMLWVLKRTISMRWSFEHQEHMFKWMVKEISTILSAQTILIWTYLSFVITHQARS